MEKFIFIMELDDSDWFSLEALIASQLLKYLAGKSPVWELEDRSITPRSENHHEALDLLSFHENCCASRQELATYEDLLTMMGKYR